MAVIGTGFVMAGFKVAISTSTSLAIRMISCKFSSCSAAFNTRMVSSADVLPSKKADNSSSDIIICLSFIMLFVFKCNFGESLYRSAFDIIEVVHGHT